MQDQSAHPRPTRTRRKFVRFTLGRAKSRLMARALELCRVERACDA